MTTRLFNRRMVDSGCRADVFSAGRDLTFSPLRTRQGFTLIEALVVIAIVGALVALVLVALQSARARARQLQCSNNLKQMALAVHAYETSLGTLPALRSGYVDTQTKLASHSVKSLLLPFVEQQAVYDRLNFNAHAAAEENQASIATVLEVFLCPARPAVLPQKNLAPSGPWVFRGLRRDGVDDPEVMAAVCDYKPSAGVSGIELTPKQKAAGLPNDGFGVWNRRPAGISSLADIPDGQSNTILWGEQAGRPDQYNRASAVSSNVDVTPYDVWGSQYNVGMEAGWGTATGSGFVSGAGEDPNEKRHVNIDNTYTLFGFHPNGANVAMGDGSVRFLTVDTPRTLVESMLIVDDGKPR